MKKMLTVIVPLALVAFASVGIATAETTGEQELNSELSQEISPDLEGASAAAGEAISGVEDDDSTLEDGELNDTNSRESNSSIADRRGRQARRGLTASGLSDVQKYWGNNNNNDEGGDDEGGGGDETPDEDEDPDVTPV